MAVLPFAEAVPRFQANENRTNTFVNGGPTEFYVASDGTHVPSVQKFLADSDVAGLITAVSTEAAARAAADTALGVRIDNGSVHLLLSGVTHTSGNFAGTVTPALPGTVPQGAELVWKPDVANTLGDTLLGAAMAFPDGSDLYPGAIRANYFNRSIYLGTKWILMESGGMEQPVTWFKRSKKWGTDPAEFLPSAPSLKDIIIVNNGSVDWDFALGGSDPGDSEKITLAPGEKFTADRRLMTPIRCRAAGPSNPVTCYFSTFDGKNPVADAGFDALLARHGSILDTPWDTALRGFYADMLPILDKCRFFYVFVGPDTTLARQNWAAENAAVATGAPDRDDNIGYIFDGTAKNLSPGLDFGDIDGNRFTLGYGTTDTTTNAGAYYALSNGLAQLALRTTGLITRSNTVSNDSWNPSTDGGLIAMTRHNSGAYESYYDGTVTHFTPRPSAAPSAYNFQIGVGVATSGVGAGLPLAGTYFNGPIDIAWLSEDLTDSEMLLVKTKRAAFLTAVSGL